MAIRVAVIDMQTSARHSARQRKRVITKWRLVSADGALSALRFKQPLKILRLQAVHPPQFAFPLLPTMCRIGETLDVAAGIDLA